MTLTEIFPPTLFSGSGSVPPTQVEVVDLANCPGGSQGCFADALDTMALFGAQCLANNFNNTFTQGFSVTIVGNGKPYSLTTQNIIAIGNFNGNLNATVTISKP